MLTMLAEIVARFSGVIGSLLIVAPVVTVFIYLFSHKELSAVAWILLVCTFFCGILLYFVLYHDKKQTDEDNSEGTMDTIEVLTQQLSLLLLALLTLLALLILLLLALLSNSVSCCFGHRSSGEHLCLCINYLLA